MSVYKPLLASDILVTPLEVGKAYNLQSPTAILNAGIGRYLGKNITGLFSTSEDTTGDTGVEYQRLVYNEIKEMYYSNYESSSYGDQPHLPVFLPNEYASGSSSSAGRFENYLQTDLTYERYFPTASNATVAVYSIPKALFGDKIEPNSFWLTDSDKGTIVDDGEGNLLMNTSPRTIVGNIIYQHGIAVITKNTAEAITGIVEGFLTGSYLQCQFSSSFTIYETQYKCTVSPSEYNFSLNETLLSGSSAYIYESSSYYQPEGGTLSSFATGSEFSPYITGIGLYNDNQELLAIAKMAKPLPTSPTSDTTIVINLDR